MNRDVLRVVRSVWGGRLGFDVRPVGREGRDEGRSLIAVVRTEQAPRSAVILECPAPLARRAAAKLRSLAPTEIPIEDVEEALGELAAEMGASLLPGARPSRPVTGIVDEHKDRPRMSGGLKRSAFACQGEVFRVTVAT